MIAAFLVFYIHFIPCKLCDIAGDIVLYQVLVKQGGINLSVVRVTQGVFALLYNKNHPTHTEQIYCSVNTLPQHL